MDVSAARELVHRSYVAKLATAERLAIEAMPKAITGNLHDLATYIARAEAAWDARVRLIGLGWVR